MRQLIYAYKKAIIAVSVLIATAFYNSFAQGFSPASQAKLQQVLENFQNSADPAFVGGISVAVKVDGLALWKGASGYAARNADENNNLLPGGSNFTTDTLSRIYSVTKTFTAALTLELVKRNVFNPDEPIVKYLPLLPSVNPSLDQNVTIRQLLAHESGYSDYTDEMDLQVAVAFAPTHIWNAYEMVSYVHQIAAPGAERRYSSTNYVLLGAIIEAATGKPVEELMRKGFFDRLKLFSMFFGGRESIGNRGKLASPHDNISAFNPIFQATGQPTFPDAYTNISRFPLDGIVSLAFTGGAIVSNAADLAEWGNALFTGKATSKATLDAMVNSISATPDGDGDRLGYGLILSNKISGNYDFVGHDGNAPGYRSIMFYQKTKKLTIVVLTNFHGADPYAIAKALYEALPSFICGDQKNNVKVCHSGKAFCLPWLVAADLIKKGGYLGACNQATTQPIASATVNDAADKLGIFPNPVTGRSTINVQVVKQGRINISLYDIHGNFISLLYSGNAEKNMQQQLFIDANKLKPGIYTCRMQTASGIISQKMIVKK